MTQEIEFCRIEASNPTEPRLVKSMVASLRTPEPPTTDKAASSVAGSPPNTPPTPSPAAVLDASPLPETLLAHDGESKGEWLRDRVAVCTGGLPGSIRVSVFVQPDWSVREARIPSGASYGPDGNECVRAIAAVVRFPTLSAVADRTCACASVRLSASDSMAATRMRDERRIHTGIDRHRRRTRRIAMDVPPTPSRTHTAH